MPVTLELRDPDGVHQLDCAAERPIDDARRVSFRIFQNNNPLTEMRVDAVLLGRPFVEAQMNMKERDQLETALEKCLPSIREQIEQANRAGECVIDVLRNHWIQVEGSDPETPIVSLQDTA